LLSKISDPIDTLGRFLSTWNVGNIAVDQKTIAKAWILGYQLSCFIKTQLPVSWLQSQPQVDTKIGKNLNFCRIDMIDDDQLRVRPNLDQQVSYSQDRGLQIASTAK